MIFVEVKEHLLQQCKKRIIKLFERLKMSDVYTEFMQ